MATKDKTSIKDTTDNGNLSTIELKAELNKHRQDQVLQCSTEFQEAIRPILERFNCVLMPIPFIDEQGRIRARLEIVARD